MFNTHHLLLTTMLCIGLSVEARADYLDTYRSLSSPQAQTALRQLQSGNFDTNYLTLDQRILFGYLADTRRAQSLLAKQAAGGKLTGGEARGLAAINNAPAILSSLPRLGQPGFVFRPQFQGN